MAIPDVPSKPVPLEFARLTKPQQRFVRQLAWEMLKTEAPFVVVVPSVFGCLGAIFGFIAGLVLGQLVFFTHQNRCRAACVVIGAGIGAWIGRIWLERECRSRFKSIIREYRDEISRMT